jgi:predicted ester cyclase
MKPIVALALVALASLLAWSRPALAVDTTETHCETPASRQLLTTYQRYAADILNGRDFSHLEAYVAPNFRWHDAPPGTPEGPAPLERLLSDLAIAYPDRQVRTRFALCADDLILVQQELTGTNTGPLLGYPPSGKVHRALHTEIYRIDEGRITELWGEGVIPLLLLQSGWTLTPPRSAP